MKDPLIHIGVHKALSSWLQNQVFKKDGPVHVPPVGSRQIVNAFGPVRTEEFNEPEWLLALRKQSAEGLQVGFSAERLSGYPMLGLYSRREIAENIFDSFPNARILIIIREQRSVILSYHLQYLKEGGALGLKRMLNPVDEHFTIRQGQFDRRYFQYSHLISLYDSVFGRERVVVLPYELFMKNRSLWVSSFEESLGISVSDCDFNKRVNPSRSILITSAHKMLNRFIVDTQLSPGGFVRSSLPRRSIEKVSPFVNRFLWSDKIDKKVHKRRYEWLNEFLQDYYHEDNKVVTERCKFDLEQLGYR